MAESIAPTPLSRWNSNEVNQQELSRFLTSPVGAELLNVLRFLAAPQSPVPPGHQGEDAVSGRALQYSELVGYHNALNNLLALTSPNVAPAPLPQPWKGTRFKPKTNLT